MSQGPVSKRKTLDPHLKKYKQITVSNGTVRKTKPQQNAALKRAQPIRPLACSATPVSQPALFAHINITNDRAPIRECPTQTAAFPTVSLSGSPLALSLRLSCFP